MNPYDFGVYQALVKLGEGFTPEELTAMKQRLSARLQDIPWDAPTPPHVLQQVRQQSVPVAAEMPLLSPNYHKLPTSLMQSGQPGVSGFAHTLAADARTPVMRPIRPPTGGSAMARLKQLLCLAPKG
jgi:hypothetical protein